ncbi:hypothetical protein J2W28_004463 [Variovorax boronicumulans]|uniref:HNH endonuclease n=1 Tax=Variovorax boronicumulans TaxID=436515 RepID=UPI002782290F|nr:HNH endonuclease [Variovorax boronicumulans]MDP9993835.1 hypothetical protein [Variovorax boronicumulans]MDQ0005301.1 hypothetical protein [Variovorax boronicumulans]
MRSLSENAVDRASLARLAKMLADDEITSGRAWACFSQPDQLKNFGDQKIAFSAAEVKAYKSLRKLASTKLFKQFKGACVYCRRPVGRYGYSWHIEHVWPKALHPRKTFLMSNLAVGCVDCNRWKGVRVDKTAAQVLPIIDPTQRGFKYSRHLGYVQISTEDLHLIKYLTKDALGAETHALLNFSEIERFTLIDSMNGDLAQLHSELRRLLGACNPEDPEDERLIELLLKLRGSIYRVQGT